MHSTRALSYRQLFCRFVCMARSRFAVDLCVFLCNQIKAITMNDLSHNTRPTIFDWSLKFRADKANKPKNSQRTASIQLYFGDRNARIETILMIQLFSFIFRFSD